VGHPGRLAALALRDEGRAGLAAPAGALDSAIVGAAADASGRAAASDVGSAPRGGAAARRAVATAVRCLCAGLVRGAGRNPAGQLESADMAMPLTGPDRHMGDEITLPISVSGQRVRANCRGRLGARRKHLRDLGPCLIPASGRRCERRLGASRAPLRRSGRIAHPQDGHARDHRFRIDVHRYL
jgi:hypothetical protein